MAQVSSISPGLSTQSGIPGNSTNFTTSTFNTWSTTPPGNRSTVAQSTTTTVLDTTTTDIGTFTTSIAGRNTTEYVISKKDDSKGSMSTGGYAGIGISCLTIFIVLIIGIFVAVRRKRRKRSPRTNFVPKLPSASDVDNTIQGLKGNNGGRSPSYDIESEGAMASPEMHSNPDLYRNIDQYGNPTDKTNPNVGDDGYLRKTSKGVQYHKEGKRKGHKKRIKTKFNKKKNKSKAQERNQTDDFETERPKHGYVNRIDNSNIRYTKGRVADVQEKEYSDVTDISKHQNENKLYENTRHPSDRYANLQTIQSEGAVTKGRCFDPQQMNEDMQQLYENITCKEGIEIQNR